MFLPLSLRSLCHGSFQVKSQSAVHSHHGCVHGQVGNAVSPAVAAALGRCLLLAAVGESPVGEAVINVPDEAYTAVR